MLVDKSDWIFSPKDLHQEWQKKVLLFRELLAQFGDKVAPLKWLLQLVEHISASDMSYRLFPGEKIEKLVISHPSNGIINHGAYLLIEPHGQSSNHWGFYLGERNKTTRAFILTHCFTCHDAQLIETFERFVLLYPDFFGQEGKV